MLLYYSAKHEKMITLDEYVAAMPEEQKDIYYAAGESIEHLAKLPMAKAVRAHGFDVLLCTEDVDEFCFQAMRTYQEKPLSNVATADLDLASDDEKKDAEEATRENEALFADMQAILGDSVTKIAVSAQLSDVPATLTTTGPVSLEMEKLLSRGPEGDKVRSQRVLELNAKHPVFETLKAAKAAEDKEKLRLYTDLLYNQALLALGMPIEDPISFAANICKLM